MRRGDERLSGARVVAAGQGVYSKSSTKPALQLLVESIAQILRQHGIPPGSVDGLAISSFQLGPDNVVTVADQLGLEVSWALQGAHGGAGGVVAVIEAAEAITRGRADVIVCASADSFTVDGHMRMLGDFNTGMKYLADYGFGGTNGIFALVEDAHRATYGTTREQLGKLAVAQRGHAQLNANALLRSPLSLDDYLNARPIALPLRLFDCVLPCEGSDAVLLMSTEAARSFGLEGLTIVAGEQAHNHASQSAISLETGAASFSSALYDRAGVGPKEVDVLQLYDDYPIMEVIQLEDLGFAEKGEGGAFVEQTDFGLAGDLPLNTGGGQLSCGQAGASGGMLGVYEAVVQLLGRAGDRQVASARTALVSGFGMVGYGRGLSSAAMILGAGR